MGMGIGVLAASLVVLGLATWMHKRNEDDPDGTVIWSIVQVMCVLAALAGAFLIYQAIAMPPKPLTDGPGWN